MPATLQRAPGVVQREVTAPIPRPPAAGVAAFVGQAERGPLNFPQPLGSWGEFADVYGGFTGQSYLAYAVFGFFSNGGERCRVVRVAHEAAARASLRLRDSAGDETLQVSAIDEGTW